MTTRVRPPFEVLSPWMTPLEAASYARTSPNMVTIACRDGSLPASQIKRGGKWRIHRDDLETWIRAGMS